MDSFFGIGFLELAFIAILALIVLGPERLPRAMRDVAKLIKQLRDISNEFTSQFSEELKVLDELNPQKIMNDLMQDATSTSSSETAKKSKPGTTSKTAVAQKTDKPLAEPNPSSAPAASSENEENSAVEVAEDQMPENSILPPTAGEAPAASDSLAPDAIASGSNGDSPDSMETNSPETSASESDAHDQTEKQA